MKINWEKLLGYALAGGVIIKTVSDVNKWINERAEGVRYDSTYNSTLVETAYDVAKMDVNLWNVLRGQLSLQSGDDKTIDFLRSYCNYVVSLENSDIKDLLSYPIREACDILYLNVQNMETYQTAAHYGILKAYAEKNMKAKALLQTYNRLLS